MNVPSKMVDNGAEGSEHEYNAKMIMSLTATEFEQLKQKAIDLSALSYSLVWQNCTDYALGVFNSIRAYPVSSYPISVPFYNLIPSSPTGLYTYLQDLKALGGPEAANVETNLNVQPPTSHGECP
jgi:hypothetical protein